MSAYVSTGVPGTTGNTNAQETSDDWRTPGVSELWAPKTSVSAASTAWLRAAADGDAIAASSLNEQLSTGNAANVTLSGGAGDDTYLINATTRIVEAAGGGIDTAYTWLAATTLADNVENLTIATGSAADGTGNGLANILTGGAGRNVLTGAGGDDRLIGGAGSDTFVFRTGDGRDTIMDFAATGADADVLRLDGYGFADFAALKTAMWQDGANVVIRLSADDSVVLRNVNLSDLTVADFDLTNVSGAVAPTVTAAPALADALQNVADAMKISGLSDLLAPAVSVTGAAKAWLKAQTDGSALSGTALNEQLSTGNAANVTLSGGAGDDTYLINATTRIVEAAGGGIDTAYTWLASTTLADNVENLTIATGSAADGTGNGLANILTGGAGRNVLTGGGGDDRLIGGAGSDTFVFRPGDGRDTIMDFAAKGADGDLIRLDGYSFADFAALQPNMWQDGANVVILLDSADSIVLRNVDLSDLTAADFAFTNVVAKPVTVVSAPKPAPVLSPTATLKAGGAGDDVLVGTAGRDAFVVSDGAGFDTIKDFQAKSGDILVIRDDDIRSFADFKAAAHQSGADLIIDLADGHSVTLQGVTLGQLSAGNVMADFSLPDSGPAGYWASARWAGQSLVGTAGNDQFSSAFDPVTLAGGRGDDVYAIVGQQSTVIEKAGEGIDTIVYWGDGLKLSDAQSIENLTLAGARASWAVGNGLDNAIRGNGSDNMLNGGAGSDVLTGGAGRDTFVVAAGQGDDVVTDFTAGVDTLRLDGFSFKSAADVVGAMTQVGSDVLLKLSAGQNLVLKNVQISDFDAGDIALPSSTAGMVQTFRDDFNSLSTFDGESGTWRTRYEWGGDAAFTQAKNGEQQIYVDPTFKGLTGKEATKALGLNPFSIENGHLVITSKPIDSSLWANTGGYKFSSGLITTEATFAQTYGHFEMRADLPEGHGAWPAFWLLPTDNSSPPELDIMEAFGDRSDMVHHALHSTTAEGAAGGWVSTGDLSGEHTFGATWTPYTVTFYVDGLQTAQYATPTDMNKPMFMLANLAVGGSWAGNAAADAIAQFKIDSITAWQLPEYTLENFKLLTSGAATNSVIGARTAETLVGTAANDMIRGAGGADTLSGGAGDDTYVVVDARAVIKEALGGGIDQVQSTVSFSLAANVENLFLKGAADIDAFGNTQSNIITGNAGDNLIRGGGGNDVLTGGAGHDVFAFTTGDGSDIITDFRTGEDTVRIEGYDLFTFSDVAAGLSQHGDDVYLALSSTDTMVFRDHRLADFSAADFQFVSELPVSGAAVRYEIGTTAGERLVGSRSNNAFDGKGGADTLIGGDGDDTYRVYYGAPTTIVEKVGQGVDTAESYISYTLGDNVENLKLLGTSLTGTGNALGNRIDGGSGADTLNGKGGDDRLFGGAGKDVFVYERGSGFDTIVDFHAKGSGSAEPDTLKFVGYGPGATLSHVGDIWTISDAQGHDSFHLTGVTSLSAGDYILG